MIDSITIKNPANNETLYEIEPEKNLGSIFSNARETQKKIEKLSVKDRLDELMKLQEYIIKNKEQIIDRIVQETGKCRTDALTSEIFGVLDVFDYYKKSAVKTLSDKSVHTPLLLMGKKSKLYYDPLGVVLIISPWNYPFYQAIVPCICAFLAGNSIVYKPSEITPLKGLIEKIIEESNFMKGAIQIVYGGKDIGRKLIEEKPDKIFFTGSVNTGKRIMASASKHLIPVDLELGGKDSMIVFDDVNIERTVNGSLWGSFTNSGQSCTSVERLYIHEEIYSKFIEVLEKKGNELKLSENSDNNLELGGYDIGSMTTDFQLEIVKDHIKDAVEKGAKILVGGKSKEGSLFFEPTILINVDETMKISTEETFGPILPVFKFATEEEVINKSNNSDYGLSASVWSKDISRAERVARKLKVGNVSINNVMLTEGNAALPFGGVKNSGFGRYKGEEGLYTFSNIKSIIVDTQSSKVEANWYPYTKKKYKLFSNLIDAVFSKKEGSLIKTIISGLKLESSANKDKI